MAMVELHFSNGRSCPFQIALADMKFEDSVFITPESQSANKQF